MDQEVVNKKIAKYREAGLEDREIELILTPVSHLSAELAQKTLRLIDKYREYVNTKNEEHRKQKEEERANQTYAERIGTPFVVAKTVV